MNRWIKGYFIVGIKMWNEKKGINFLYILVQKFHWLTSVKGNKNNLMRLELGSII